MDVSVQVFGQVGAVLGTAILVAIVGDPVGLADALSVSDAAYLFAVFTALAAGAVTFALRPASRSEVVAADPSAHAATSIVTPAGVSSGSEL